MSTVTARSKARARRNSDVDQQIAQGKDLYIMVDRIVVKEFDEDDIHRMNDSIGTAFYEGEGDVYVEVDGEKLVHFNNRFELDGMIFEEPSPNLFSFNNP